MEELRERATDEVKVAEMKQSYRKEAQEEAKEKAENRKSEVQPGKTRGFKPR